MFQYVLKRLALMVVTLFGISIVTFAITRLAPGDPAAMRVLGATGATGGKGQQLSDFIIEENRRILGLDKPILLNFKPKGRSGNVRRLINDLGSPEEYVRERTGKTLTLLGSAALAGAIEALDQATTAGVRETLLKLLPKLAACERPVEYTSFSVTQQILWWRQWWADNRARYDPENIQRVVDTYFAHLPEASSQPVVAIGGCAVPFLIRRLKARDHETADRATALLTQIVGRAWNNLGQTAKDVRRDNLNRWQSWWKSYHANYIEFTGFRRWSRIITDTQYGVWFGKLLAFDFDESFVQHRPVLRIILERLPVSLQLSLISIFLTYLIAVPLGVFSATHQFKLSDKIVTTFLFILYSMPSFWVADMLILFTTGGSFFNWFPTQGLHSSGAAALAWLPWLKDWVWHLVLPIACLTYADFAFLSRQSRVAMLETVRQDFIRTAQAKGLSQRAVIFKHALRNSMIPILTLMASLLPELLGGSLIIETIFGIRGMGQLTIESIMNRDYAVINAVAFFSALLTLLGILLSDLSYAFVDPRIRYE